MGHSSIQITVDVYGHLIPGANITWVDRADSETSLPPNPHQGRTKPAKTQSKRGKSLKRIGCPQGFEPRDADPELMDRCSENPWFYAEESETYLQLKSRTEAR